MAVRIIFWSGLALAFLTGLTNIGIIAIDDYNNGFAEMIPAQHAKPVQELLKSGIHPVLPKPILSGLAVLIWKLGVEDPLWQLRWSLAVIGLICFLLNWAATRRLFEKDPDALRWPIAGFLIAFYFTMPLFYSRPMIETFSMPFLTLSALFANRYATAGGLRALLLALVLLAVGSMMRFQVGVCWTALFVLVLLRKSGRDIAALLAGSALLFLVTGLLDWFAQGRFHGQLINYFVYCLEAGTIFGKMPFYTFLLLTFALTLPPTFLASYGGMDWKREYRRIIGPLLYFAVFLIAHTFSPHKEERFFVPALPIFLFCLVPAAAFLWRNGGRWRRAWFLGLNGVLLVLACTNVPQQNLISLASWLTHHPEIERVDAVDKALVIRPQAFVLRPIRWEDQSKATVDAKDCRRLTVLRWDTNTEGDFERAFRQVAVFSPSPVERLLVRLNPQNARRGPLRAYLPASCP